MAEREGFEPSVRLPAHVISNHAPSATRSPLRYRFGLKSFNFSNALILTEETGPCKLFARLLPTFKIPLCAFACHTVTGFVCWIKNIFLNNFKRHYEFTQLQSQYSILVHHERKTLPKKYYSNFIFDCHNHCTSFSHWFCRVG